MTACTNCRTSTTTCPRCATPQCSDHTAMYSDTCVDCALAYYDSRERVNMKGWFVAGFMLPWLGYVALLVNDLLPRWDMRSGGHRAITTGFPALDVIIMFTIIAVFAGMGAMRVREHIHKRAFMHRPLPRATINA